MRSSGWVEVRRRGVVILLALVVGVTGLMVADRWPDGSSGDPGAGSAGAARLTASEQDGLKAVDIPLTGRRTGRMRADADRFRTDVIETTSFSMLGVTWDGAPQRMRAKLRKDGGWTRWQRLEGLHDGPDEDTAEGRGARTGTKLQWVDEADAVRIEISGGRPDNLTLTLMSAQSAERVQTARKKDRNNRRRPVIRSRRDWGADNSLRNGRPSYNRTIQQVHVHHTVNSHRYSRRDVPGMIRGMYRYHTQNLGWSDIGYNFLVDRFGRIWLGRGGGANDPVRGAHTLGFNKTSTGVAAIGNFESGRAYRRVVYAAVRLAAWKLARYDRNPKGKVRVYSHGSDRYREGAKVKLPTIDGHRDTNYTACPGINLYRELPEIRWRAKKRIDRLW